MAAMTDPAGTADLADPADTALRLETRISHVRHDGRDHRVVRPRQLATGFVLQSWTNVLTLDVDRPALDQLAAAWSLAAFSPRSIIFLPSRRNAGRTTHPKLDLVLLHASLQFPLAQWRTLRSRLGAGDLHTVRPAPPSVPPDLTADRDRWAARQSRNRVVFDSAADTLFVVGNRDGFRLTSRPVDNLRTDPDACFDPAAGHSCVLLSGGRRRSGTGRHATAGILHVAYVPDSPRVPKIPATSATSVVSANSAAPAAPAPA